MTQTQKNTYCHVFDIHFSLSLQLGNYLPVEPLKLQVWREGEEASGNKGDENGEHMQMIREPLAPLLSPGRQRERERSPTGEQRVIIRGASLSACRGERRVWGCAYEWVRNKAWERVLRSRSLEPECGERCASLWTRWGAIRVSMMGQNDDLRESVVPRWQCLINAALNYGRWDVFPYHFTTRRDALCDSSTQVHLHSNLHSGAASVSVAARHSQLCCKHTSVLVTSREKIYSTILVPRLHFTKCFKYFFEINQLKNAA